MSKISTDIVLDAYAARSCPVKIQNQFDSTISLDAFDASEPVTANSEMLQEVFAGEQEFKTQVFDVIARSRDSIDLRKLASEDQILREQATASAVKSGVTAIICPSLPVVGQRSGQPDLLIRSNNHSADDPKYLPVQIKQHRMLERITRQGDSVASSLNKPGFELARAILDANFRFNREKDLLQLAHYWRQLEDLGWCADQPIGGVIGTDRLARLNGKLRLVSDLPDMGDLQISWAHLDAKQIRTYSKKAASSWKLRSALDRYDHEFTFRLKVAKVASEHQPGDVDARAMVAPIVVHECESCQWWRVCEPQLDDNDLSLRISKSPLDVREITVLRSMGIKTVNDLVDVDIDEILPNYLPLVKHRPSSEKRIRLAAHRARMLRDEVEVERITTGPLGLPESQIEIDLDIETSSEDVIYLWGFLVRDRANPNDRGSYRSFCSFEEMSAEQEGKLADEALAWLAKQLTKYPDAMVYHYSDYETIHIRRLAKSTGLDHIVAMTQLIPQRFFDLFDVMRSNFFGAHGLGLKAVAHSAAGFSWRDESPGGLNSQFWFNDAVHAAQVEDRILAAQRILEYNEDDVRATSALRDWLRETQ